VSPFGETTDIAKLVSFAPQGDIRTYSKWSAPNLLPLIRSVRGDARACQRIVRWRTSATAPLRRLFSNECLNAGTEVLAAITLAY
jgi:hypothetical protein